MPTWPAFHDNVGFEVQEQILQLASLTKGIEPTFSNDNKKVLSVADCKRTLHDAHISCIRSQFSRRIHLQLQASKKEVELQPVSGVRSGCSNASCVIPSKPRIWRASDGLEAKGYLQSIPLCPIYGLKNPSRSMLRVCQDGRHYMSDTFRNSCETASL